MLFQVFPKQAERDDLGRPEKFQFDASGIGSMSPTGFAFKDFLDLNVSPDIVRERFPYLYTDLIKGLKEKDNALENAMQEMKEDPLLQQPDTKTKKYNIEDEIKKLAKMKNAGYFTDEVRPANAPKTEPQDNKQLPGTTSRLPESTNKGNPTMENIDKDVAAMLNSLKKYDMLTESVAPVMGMVTLGEKKGAKPDFLDFDKDEDKKEPMTKALKDKKEQESDSEGGEIDESEAVSEFYHYEKSDKGKKNDAFKKKEDKESADKKKQEKSLWKKKESGKLDEDDKEKVEEGADQEVLTWMKRFASLGKMSGY